MNDSETIDLENADAAKFAQLIEDMQYRAFKLARIVKPDKPLSYFEAGWPMEQLIRFENRYRREAKP